MELVEGFFPGKIFTKASMETAMIWNRYNLQMCKETRQVNRENRNNGIRTSDPQWPLQQSNQLSYYSPYVVFGAYQPNRFKTIMEHLKYTMHLIS